LVGPFQKWPFQGQDFFPLLDSSYKYSLSLEVCVADPSPLNGGLLFMVDGSWKDHHIGQSQETPYYRDQQMLHVQEDGGVRGPSPSPFRCGFCLVVLSFQSFWVMPGRVIDLLACWWSLGQSRSATVWKIMPTCLFWCLWREINNRNFEDMEKTPEELLSSFYYTLYLWTTVYVFSLSSFSFLDFLTCFFSWAFPFVYSQFTKGRLTLLMRLAYYLYKKKLISKPSYSLWGQLSWLL
jgi:hypothetical protein